MFRIIFQEALKFVAVCAVGFLFLYVTAGVPFEKIAPWVALYR